MKRVALPWGATLVLFGLLAWIRLGSVGDLGLRVADAWRLGLGVGLVYDLLLALIPLAASRVAWAGFRAPQAIVWSGLAFLFVAATAGNAAYASYFGGRLTAWAIRHHAVDLVAYRGVAGSLLGPPAWIAVAALAIGIAAWLLSRRGGTDAPPTREARLADGVAGVGLILVVAFGLVACSTARPRLGTLLDDQIVFMWAKTAFDTRRQTALDEQHRDQVSRLLSGSAADAEDSRVPGATLARFRDLQRAGPVPSARSGYPLLQVVESEPDAVRALRRELGLPEDRAPNVIVLFLESVRALELRHPELGPLVFPKLRALLAAHAWDYRQAYSSAVSAGLTVRGQFSTLCSQLPNLRGPATYVARYDLRVRCLPELARENGYRTFWVSSQDKGFHHKALFEAVHGTEHFYDEAYFARLGLPKNFDGCGVADGPFLLSYLELLEELDEDPRPFFANALTITTHVPHTVLPDVSLPDALVARAPSDESLGYLTRLRYLDDSLDGFFRAFFESPVSEDTVVVLLGDHGLNVAPALADLAPHQRVEMISRIPLAIVTRGLRPRVIQAPVHQIDVAPTIARIAGLSGEATWLGRPVDAGPGSPWVMARAGSGLQYRLGSRACYSTPALASRRCFDVSGADPLLVGDLPPVPVDPHEAAFLGSVLDAQSRIIARDEIAPKRAL